MIDKTELKRLAEACGNLNWRAIQENWCEWAIRDDHAYIATMHTKSAKHPGPCSEREAKAKFLCAMTPAAVLALIAENKHLAMCARQWEEAAMQWGAERDQLKTENERQAAQFKEWQAGHHANYVKVAKERDQLRDEIEQLERGGKNDAIAYKAAIERQEELRAEIAGLKTGYQAYELESAELKAENEALRKDLESHKRMLLSAAVGIGSIGEALGAQMDDDSSEIEGLAIELRKDAERYRWTSIEGNWVARMFGKWRAHIGEYGDASPTEWYATREEAIDAAMGKGEQP